MSFQIRYLLGVIATVVAMTISIALTTDLSAGESQSKSDPVTHVVEIKQFKFMPDTIEIKAGDTITWINRDIVPHTATASDKSWDTGMIKTNESKSITFESDSISSYFCFYHPVMKAEFKMKMVN